MNWIAFNIYVTEVNNKNQFKKSIYYLTKLLYKGFNILNIIQRCLYVLLNYFHKHYLKFISGSYYCNNRIYLEKSPLIEPRCATVTGQKQSSNFGPRKYNKSIYILYLCK